VHTPRWPYAVALVLVALAAASVFLQRGKALALRAELAGQRAQREDAVRLRAANEKLTREQLAPAEFERLQSDHVVVTRLRAEIDELKGHASETPPPPARNSGGSRATPSITEQTIAASAWKNAGRATAAAATETALWAAAAGDIDTLAASLAFDGDALSRANALFATLPAAERSRYACAERLVATLAARDIPLGSARILASKQQPEGTQMALLLRDADNLNPKVVWLSLREDNSGWKLVVPPAAIGKYSASLGAAASPAH